MKIKQFFKKAAATVMAAVTVLSLLPTTAFAATGDVGTISFTRTYDSAGNAMYYNSSAVINGYTAGGTGKNKYRMYVDGSTAFCIQPGVPLKTGNQLTENSSETWNALSASQKKAVGLALLYGYQGNRDGLTGSDDEKWLATQTLVWEFVTGCRNSTGSFAQTDTTVYSLHFGSNYPNSGARAAYDQIVSMLTKHNTVPSFMNGSTRDLEYKDGQYVLTLTDTNGVLSEYSFSSSDRNVSVSKSGNTLTISSANAFSGSVRITATRNNIPVVSESAKLIAYGDPNLQDLVTGVENTDGVSAYLNVETPTGTIGLKKTSEDGKVEGITFTVEGNGIQQTVKTNAAGEILIDGLTPGVYTVTEQSYEKYEPQSVQRVTVIGGRTSTVTFNNVLKRGDLTVTKTSEDGLVEGMKFHLYGTSLSGIAVDEYAVTDSSGKAYFKDVLIGSGYVLEEVDTPIRYVVPESQTAAVEWNTVTEKSVSNVLKKWNATVTKSDRETGTAQGNAYLAGATYGIYKGDQLVDTYTTDANGQFITAYYVCDDDWSIREISPSEGYLLDETSYHVGAEPQLYTVEYNSAANDVNEQVIKGSIALIKHTDDGETKLETPEAGAEFSVYLKSSGSYDAAKDSERDTLICDENGFAQTKQLPYGIYTVHQVSGWEGRELMDDFDVFIAKDAQTYRYLINNSNFESYIQVVKVDAETGKTIPYAGAGFQIYDSSGNLITMEFTYPTPTTVDTFYTDANGSLVTPEKLPYGQGYSIVEVQSPYGYVLDSTPVYFDVTEENSSEESEVTVIKVEKTNMPQKGTISIEKTGEVFFGVLVSGGTDENGQELPVIYQPIYETQGLPDTVYEIRAAEDVVTPDGTLRYSKGELVDTVTTDETGFAKSKELYLGKYEVKEVKAGYGMVLSSEVHTVELIYAGQDVAVTETATSFVNERQKVEVSLEKALETNELFGIGNNGEIKNISFGLFADEELVSASGTSIPKDGLLEIITLDENGRATVGTDLPLGSYYVKELATDEHYQLSGEKYPVVFEYAGQEAATVVIAVNDGEPMENKLIYGSVSGKKVDENGEGLGGALIGLFKSDDVEFTEENALMTVVSGDDGSFSFENVPYGSWYIREIKQPTGFVLDETVYDVNISENEQVVEIEIVNKLVRGNIALMKVDAEYTDTKLTGAVFEVYKDSNDNGELDSEDELIGTLTEKEIGQYEMNDLLYGRYFILESASPDSYIRDEGVYEVFIDTDGKTYQVENTEGKGFANEPMRGNLKIVKTSSDRKVEGFAFRITGENGYDVTLETDENGEIFLEGLRIGEYKISEVNNSASAMYILPADKEAAVQTGSTTVVEMHNELRDTPKTGDDSKLGLWLALAGVSAAGIAACGIIGFKKKKKKEDN